MDPYEWVSNTFRWISSFWTPDSNMSRFQRNVDEPGQESLVQEVPKGHVICQSPDELKFFVYAVMLEKMKISPPFSGF